MTRTCATCKHWHGSESSYRAKCEANSGVDTISTAFDDTCTLWESKQPPQPTANRYGHGEVLTVKNNLTGETITLPVQEWKRS